MSGADSVALAGQTFYRAIASPARSGWCSYIQLLNPPNSGVNAYFDAVYVWPGLTVSGEYGILHYATAFDDPSVSGLIKDVFTAPLLPTYYGAAAPKTRLLAGTYPSNIVARVDYFFQGPVVGEGAKLEKFPYPIIFGPGDGILLWNASPSLEGKAGMWIREKPIT